MRVRVPPRALSSHHGTRKAVGASGINIEASVNRALLGYLAVFVGAGVGGMARHGIGRLVGGAVGFPWGTLLVNVTGSLAIGLLAGKLGRGSDGDVARPFLMTGLIGGYTTFSAFALETSSLWERGARFAAVGYLGGSVLLAIAAAAMGIALTR